MELPLMALRETVVLPGTMAAFVVGRAASVHALREAIAGDQKILLVAQRDTTVEEPKADDLFRVGTIANIVESLRLPDGNFKLVVEGLQRAELLSVADNDGFLRAAVRIPPADKEPPMRVEALVTRVVKLGQPGVEGSGWRALGLEDPGKLADVVGERRLSFTEKQEILEIFDPLERLLRLSALLGTGAYNVSISMAVLTRWAESCAMMDRLGSMTRVEMEGLNRTSRVRDLNERSRRLARHMADELAVYGARKP